MTMTDRTNDLLETIAENLEVPPSYYEKAADRYRSLGEWLHREESTVAAFEPQVYPQGSFRYGTVNWPLLKTEEYDLDAACEINIPKSRVSQKQLKELLGREIRAYAQRYHIQKPVDEGNRCWRLDYADHVLFHIDVLPCVPEDIAFIQTMQATGLIHGLLLRPSPLQTNATQNMNRSQPTGSAVTRAGSGPGSRTVPVPPLPPAWPTYCRRRSTARSTKSRPIGGKPLSSR